MPAPAPVPPAPAHPCARCAAMQKTCCQRAEILVTEGDLRRIMAFTGLRDFFHRQPVTDPGYLDQDDDPNWLRYTLDKDGARRVLRKQPGGDCTFLGPQGCVLPEDTRPLVCRLYPWTYTESGIDGEDADYCPSAHRAEAQARGVTMITILGMPPRDVGEAWRAQLYDELRAEYLSGQPSPSGAAQASRL